jgi:hypothetical protein
MEQGYFGLRNWEPARRVGVRRTNADFGFLISKFQIRNVGFTLCSLLYATLHILDTLGILDICIHEIPPRSHTWPLLPH